MSEYPQLQHHNHVALIWFGDDKNVLNTPFLNRLNSLLDRVTNEEKFAECSILVTSGKGRFYSNGIDLNWLYQQQEGLEGIKKFVVLLHKTLARILTFPLVTVAALNGHAFAGGAMLAMAHDCRVMQTKQGWLSLPEVFLGLPFRVGMTELLKCKIPVTAQRDFILLGHRLTAERAKDLGLIEKAVDSTDQKVLLQEATEQGERMLAGRQFERRNLGILKSDLYAGVLRGLEDDDGSPDPRVSHGPSRL